MFDDLTLQRRLFNLLEIVGKGQLTTFVQERETDRQTGREREREIYRTYLERGGVPELTMLVSSEGKIYKCRGRVHLTDDVFTPTRVSLLLN